MIGRRPIWARIRPASKPHGPAPITTDARVTPGALHRALEQLKTLQPLTHVTGSLHAAAWADASGNITLVREDVGRHNALDKVIGALARAGRVPAEGFFVVTSRASYELVQKTAVAGAPLLAAVSRPTGLAIRFAEESGIALVGLVRGETANVYSHTHRVVS